MFEFSRELKRFFQADASKDGLKDGLTGGDASLLELLELKMLEAEARAADIAVGRISAQDRPMRRLEAAIVWREMARRTGDPIALRKAASSAELAATGFKEEHRMQGWARARCEQAGVAMLGADLFGDDGLNAAADIAFAEAAAIGGNGMAPAIANLGRAQIAARCAIGAADRAQTLAIAARFEAPCQALEVQGRRRAVGRLMAAQGKADRAQFLTGCGLRLKDPMLLRMALDGLAQSLTRLDSAYEPLTWARATVLRAMAKTALADLDGEVGAIAEAMNELVEVLEHVGRHHSPLDWVKAQTALGGALQMLGEAGGGQTSAFEQSIACLDRALTVLNAQPALTERSAVAYSRAVGIARRAELAGDLRTLAQAEAALRAELASFKPTLDPVGWAVRQLNFARLYEARASLAGPDQHDRRAAALALSAALDVFGEHGLRSLADIAARGLERLRVAAA